MITDRTSADTAAGTSSSAHPSPLWAGRRADLCRGPGAPRVLVTFASLHGATREIAAALARSLAGSQAGQRVGLRVALAPVQMRPRPARFDAVVLGSAIYDGRWLSPARRFASSAADELSSRPTWLFSSGLAVRPSAPEDLDDARWIADSIRARGHRMFPGRLERRLLSAAERAVVPGGADVDGDFRDWPAVREWADQIAAVVVPRECLAAVG